MTIGRIKEGDVVHCDVRGQRFFAIVGQGGDAFDTVTGRPRKLLILRQMNGRAIPTHTVKPRQVIGHWRMRKGSVL